MTTVTMPQLGETVVEGTITKWLKQEGDHVDQDEPLFEISTDKVDTEVPSPASGTLTKILVQEGETVDVGTKLAQLGGAGGGDAEPEAPAPAAQEPATQEAAREADAPSPAETPQPAQTPPKPPAAAPQTAPAEALPGEQLEPISAMRRGIAEHMRRSLDTSAHVTSAIEVDMSQVVAAREKLKKDYQAAYGVNPTYLAFIARATGETLRDYPYVNGELRGGQN